jgi:cold-inducible RNA-binding protein
MKSIFIGNLSFSVTEAALRWLFEAYGSVASVNIVTDRDSGQPRGFGFVEMTTDAEAAKAINGLSGKVLEGRTLNVNEARPKAERPAGGGYGRQRRKRSDRADCIPSERRAQSKHGGIRTTKPKTPAQPAKSAT